MKLNLTIDSTKQDEIKEAIGFLTSLETPTAAASPTVKTPTAAPTAAASPTVKTPTAAPTAAESSPSVDVQAQKAPTAPAAAAPAESEDDKTGLDAEGIRWDGRIHSSSGKKIVKTGTWKRIRGVSPELVAQVEAELRGSATVAVDRSTGEVVSEVVTTAVEPTPTPTPAATVETFAQLMPIVTKAAAAGTISPTALQETITSLGLASIPQLATPDGAAMISTVYALLFQNG